MWVETDGQRVWMGGSQTGGVELIDTVDGVVYDVQLAGPPNAANDRLAESFRVRLLRASH